MDQIKSGTGMQTLSSELASSSQLRHNTFGVPVSSLIVLVNPLLFNMHMWPWCFSSQRHSFTSPMTSPWVKT